MAQVEEWEREQQRGAMQPPAMHSPRSHFDDVKGLLPSMCDSDALSFFILAYWHSGILLVFTGYYGSDS